jgi:hypothetical protein
MSFSRPSIAELTKLKSVYCINSRLSCSVHNKLRLFLFLVFKKVSIFNVHKKRGFIFNIRAEWSSFNSYIRTKQGTIICLVFAQRSRPLDCSLLFHWTIWKCVLRASNFLFRFGKFLIIFKLCNKRHLFLHTCCFRCVQF